MGYYYYCNTCGQSSGHEFEHYDEKELVGLWKARRGIVDILSNNIPLKIYDGISFIAPWIERHYLHDVQINTTNSCDFYSEIPPDENPGTELINLRQLISKDGLKSEIVMCEPNTPRTVETICKVDKKGSYYTDPMPDVGIPKTRRYRYRKDVPAIIRIYEEVETA